MVTTISPQTKTELLEALRQRYQQASKPDKAKILDEFVAVAGCHRKHAIRLLNSAPGAAPLAPPAGRRIYDEAVREALVVLWEAADRICGKRLKMILPRLLRALEQPEPGFLEIDFVAHGGDSMHGTFLWSLVATDVGSGWTEMVPPAGARTIPGRRRAGGDRPAAADADAGHRFR